MEAWSPSALAPLATVTRGGRTESLHLGAVAVADGRGALHAASGDPSLVTYLRSAAKPIQALVVVESGAADAFGLGPRELAVIAGSHSGEPAHVAAVQDILAHCGLGEEALQCGAQAPLARDAAAALAAAGEAPRAIHHNCSGKHAGMLAVCVHRGWPRDRYPDAAHPLQHLVKNAIADLSGLQSDEVGVGVDGCGVPTFAVSLRAMARLFAELAAPLDLPAARATALDRVRAAMCAHPHLVAGSRRLDTDLLQVAAGGVVVKGGAEGVHCAGLPTERLGLALKVADGAARATGPALLGALAALAALDPEPLAALARHARPTLRNSRGQEVGAVVSAVKLSPMWGGEQSAG